MINWVNAEEDEIQLLNAIKSLLENHPKLLTFLFHPLIPRLNDTPEQLLDSALVFSTGECILVQIAIELWDGRPIVKFADIYSYLDNNTYFKLLKIINTLKR